MVVHRNEKFFFTTTKQYIRIPHLCEQRNNKKFTTNNYVDITHTRD